MKPETRFRKNQIDPFLKTLRIFVDSIQQVSIRGTPDYYLCIQGRFVALEIKWTGGRLSKLQIYRLGCIRDSGGIAICVTPENWGEVKTLLTDLQRKGRVCPLKLNILMSQEASFKIA